MEMIEKLFLNKSFFNKNLKKGKENLIFWGGGGENKNQSFCCYKRITGEKNIKL